MLSPPNWPLYS